MLKKLRVIFLVVGILSSLLSLSTIYNSRDFFRNMYTDYLVFYLNIYAQMISVILFIVLLVLMILKFAKPYFFTVIGSIMILINLGGMILYTVSVDSFYLNLYAVRGIALLCIGILIQLGKTNLAKNISFYFILEFLIFQVASMSSDSIFYMVKTFETNAIVALLMSCSSLIIPLYLNFYLPERDALADDSMKKQINIYHLAKITSWISIAYLAVLIIRSVPYLLPAIADGSIGIVIYMQVSAVLRITLFSLLITSFIGVIRNSYNKKLLVITAILIAANAFLPLVVYFQYYLPRYYMLLVVIIDFIVLAFLTIYIYKGRYKVSFFLSLWFIVNTFLYSIQLTNIEYMIISNVLWNSLNTLILLKIFYYFIPITIALLLYDRYKNTPVIVQPNEELL